jgi:hypothetical protein
MAANQGFSKNVTNGMIFSYDTGDPYNCFKGKPTTNLVPLITNLQGTNDTLYFKTNYGTEDVYIQGLGGVRNVTYCNIYNDYVGGSGQCCPNLFYFNQISVNASTEYVYQIIYRTETGYSSPNYMYQYQYGASGLISEFGLLDSTRQEDLGGGWKHAWGTFTTNASATYIRPYLFHYEYATYNKVQLAGVMISQGSQVLRPRQFLPVAATRSSTQSLYNLSKNIGIDLTSVSFDASGSLLFDGTDDNITTDITYPGANATFEVVIKCLGSVNTFNMFMGSFLPYMGVYQGNSIIFSDYIASVQRTVTTSAGTISLNVWNHVVCTRYYDGVNTTNTIYINGVSRGSNTFSGSPTNLGNSINIGDGQTTNWYPFSGYVAVAKIYNRNLSNIEILDNYANYKRRFNLA